MEIHGPANPESETPVVDRCTVSLDTGHLSVVYMDKEALGKTFSIMDTP